MKNVYGYIRVSTHKQKKGVSMEEQKRAITRYAEQRNLYIVQWFEEYITAGKTGRPKYSAMLELLRKKKVDGVIIHKIDRSSRNLHDWLDLTDLYDIHGIEVHSAHESFDLQTRGGRLSANMQAVVATDMIMNQRQETIKGLYGRLEQGIYPFGAPVGYKDMGKGKLKEIDPITGPLIRQVYEFYATRKYGLHQLVEVVDKLGLRNINGSKIQVTTLSRILNNPFYMGLLVVKGKSFQGKHVPLVSPALYKKVQLILKGKVNDRVRTHDFLFRKAITCKPCGYSLIGERQKGKVYYRCHTPTCPTKGLRESNLYTWLLNAYEMVEFTPIEMKEIDALVLASQADWEKQHTEVLQSIRLQKQQVINRIERLNDVFLEPDNALGQEEYNTRKLALLTELKGIEHRESEVKGNKAIVFQNVQKFLELAKSLTALDEITNPDEKREMIKKATSNLSTEGKNLVVTMKSPFTELVNRELIAECDHPWGGSRTLYPTIVFSDINTSPIKPRPLTRKQLRTFIDHLIEQFSLLAKNDSDF